MTRPEFERQMASLRERIANLPPDQRDALEELARETVKRHEQIRRSSLEGSRAIERLELAFERLGEACRRVTGLADEARRLLERARAQQRSEPGLN